MLFEHIKLLNENFEVCEDMYLETEGDIIKYIGKERPKQFCGSVIDGRDKFLMPGFYNNHCHIPMVMLRGNGEDLPLHRWLTERCFPYEGQMTGEDCYWGSMLGAMELISSGVVSFSDMYFNILDIARAVDESGLKANISHGLSGEGEDRAALEKLSGYRDTLALMEQVKGGDGRIIVDAGLHAEYTSSEGHVRAVAEFAKEHGLIVHTHISETRKEHEECKVRRGGRTPMKFFLDCGLLDSPTQAAHCVWVEEGDIEIMRERPLTMTHNISSNLKLGSGIVNTAELLKKGVRIAIGTDGAASNNNLNMLEEIHLAAMVAKGLNQDPTALSLKEIVTMATLTGAKAQGRTNCGVIKEGYKADFILFNLDTPHMKPDTDTLANVIFAAEASDICMSVIDGKIVYRDGVFPFIDRERVIYEVCERHKRIMASLGR